MKRDIECIRDILLIIEKSDGELASDSISSPNYNTATRDYHVRLLYEAGWIEGIDATSHDGYSLMNMRLTWYGHDFLDSIRDEGVWSNVREKLKAVGGTTTLEVLKALAVSVAKEKLGLSGS